MQDALFIAVTRADTEYAAAGEMVERHLDRAGATLIALLADVAAQASQRSLAVIAEGIGAMSFASSGSMGATPATAERLRLASHRLAATATSPPG